jgi:hypothetical protein
MRQAAFVMTIALAMFLTIPERVAAGEKTREWTGTAGKTDDGIPTLAASNGVKFRLKAAADATDSVKETLKKIGGGELTGTFKVAGTRAEEGGAKWIAVTSIDKDVSARESGGEKTEKTGKHKSGGGDDGGLSRTTK